MTVYSLEPRNKHVWVQDLDKGTDHDKVGSLYVVGGSGSNQYRLATVKAFCPDVEGIEVGDTVLYDTLGAVSHRIGNQSITTVKGLNILGVVRAVAEKSE